MQQAQLQQSLTKVSNLSYDLNEWQKGCLSQPQEFDYWIDNVEGQIPRDLKGTFFRNGPGLLDINEEELHPFDGDGMICAIAIHDGRAYFRNRFVRTEGFLAEQKAGKILYRGIFGTQKAGGWLANAFDLRIKNIANTNVIYWGGKLLALWECAEPHRLDPLTLDTIDLEHLDGVLNPGNAFGAHPHIDPNCHLDNGEPCLVNFAVKAGLSSKITIYELNTVGKVVRQHTHSIPGFAFMHDMAITPNYCIFFHNPVTFNPLPFILGWSAAGQCIQFAPKQPTRIIIIPRNGIGKVQIIETEPCFSFHHANAFEQDDEIVIDSICYDSFMAVGPNTNFLKLDFDTLPAGQIRRFNMNLKTKTVRHQVIESRCCEFPCLHPNKVGRPYRYLYAGTAHAPTGTAPLQAVIKLDLETGNRQLWSAAPRGFIGEPVFVPRPSGTQEDDGWLLVFSYDAAHHRSDVVILDARNLNKGPMARLHLKHHIPYGLHGNFTPEWFGPINK